MSSSGSFNILGLKEMDTIRIHTKTKMIGLSWMMVLK